MKTLTKEQVLEIIGEDQALIEIVNGTTIKTWLGRSRDIENQLRAEQRKKLGRLLQE